MINIDFRQIIHALSDTLDQVGIDDFYHGKRVAFMAVECIKAMGFHGKALDTIHHASLLHDCGVSTTTEHKKLVSELDWEDSDFHCQRGSKLLERHKLFSLYCLICNSG